MRFLIIAMAITLTACGPVEQFTAHMCDRRELFQQCMSALPAGPTSTMYNDWDEVVKSCDAVSYKQARRIRIDQQPESCPAPSAAKTQEETNKCK